MYPLTRTLRLLALMITCSWQPAPHPTPQSPPPAVRQLPGHVVRPVAQHACPGLHHAVCGQRRAGAPQVWCHSRPALAVLQVACAGPATQTAQNSHHHAHLYPCPPTSPFDLPSARTVHRRWQEQAVVAMIWQLFTDPENLWRIPKEEMKWEVGAARYVESCTQQASKLEEGHHSS